VLLDPVRASGRTEGRSTYDATDAPVCDRVWQFGPLFWIEKARVFPLVFALGTPRGLLLVDETS
jgi:hypothetical protein